ncbi:hypothetical protein BHE74_00031263, partial [Ensete ventricosum]
RCGGRRNNEERTATLGLCGCGRGVEMATQYRGRRGVGVSDNSGDAVREPDAGISATAVADIWGSGNGKGAGERGDRGLRLKAALMLAMVLGCDRMAIAAMRC